MKLYTCRSSLGMVTLFTALAVVGRAQFPVPTILRTEYPWREGHFGQSCAIDNGIVAVCSEADYFHPLERGGVTIFERGAGGDWVQTQLLRVSQTFPTQFGLFAEQVEMVGNSLMVLSGGNVEA